MRKIGIGTAGDVITGSQLLIDNTITTLLANEDLTLILMAQVKLK